MTATEMLGDREVNAGGVRHCGPCAVQWRGDDRCWNCGQPGTDALTALGRTVREVREVQVVTTHGEPGMRVP